MNEALDPRDVDCEACGARASENCLSLVTAGVPVRPHVGRRVAARIRRLPVVPAEELAVMPDHVADDMGELRGTIYRRRP